MKYNNMFYFFRGCFIQIKSNKSKTVLTIFGVFLAAILFLVVSIFVESYIESLYSEAKACSEEGVLITGTLSEDIVNDLEIKYGNNKLSRFNSVITSYSYFYSWDEMTLSVMPLIIGTNSNIMDGPVYSTQGFSSMFSSKIMQGSDIQYEDVINKNRVVLISEMAADILYGGEDAVGKELALSFTGEAEDKEIFTVIGVYKNSYDEDKVMEQLILSRKKDLRTCNVQINCFVPYTIYGDYELVNNDIQAITILTTNDVTKKKEIASYYSNVDTLDVQYTEEKIQDIENINKDIFIVTRVLMVVVMLIAGLNLFNCLFFSVRERTSEIGIRKAIGAENMDILIQFVIEGVIMSISGALIAVIVVVVCAIIIQMVLDNFSILNIEIVLSYRTIFEMFCYVIIMGVISSIIPAFIASKTNIIDAIRFD